MGAAGDHPTAQQPTPAAIATPPPAPVGTSPTPFSAPTDGTTVQGFIQQAAPAPDQATLATAYHQQASYQPQTAVQGYIQPGAFPPPAPGGSAVTTGYATLGPLDSAAPLYCPPEQTGPVFLGARVGHAPINLHCGACGYQGPSQIKGTRGWAHGMWAMMTLGLGLLVPVALDTQHYCPHCGKHVAVAKLM